MVADRGTEAEPPAELAAELAARLAEVRFAEVTGGLAFPEGPVAMPDGSVIVVEMHAERVTRVRPDGTKELIAEVPGGPNGAAVGPDGALYLCNNGGCFPAVRRGDRMVSAGPFDPARYSHGRIERLDPATAELTELYRESDGHPLRAPNDLVFDSAGGMWFTDYGINDRRRRVRDYTGIHYAAADGSAISEQAYPADNPNGIGLAPDGGTVYWAETSTGRLMQRRLSEPGVAIAPQPADTSFCLFGIGGYQLFDSLAVDGLGNVCVATLISGAITVVSPQGVLLGQVFTGDPSTTNLCFGDADGSGTFRDVYVTASSSGRLLKGRWPWPGGRLHWQ